MDRAGRASWSGSSDLDRLLELGYPRAGCEAALKKTNGDMRAAAMALVDDTSVFVEEEQPPELEPEPEPEPGEAQEGGDVVVGDDLSEGVPPGAELVQTNTLPARSYSGEEVSATMQEPLAVAVSSRPGLESGCTGDDDVSWHRLESGSENCQQPALSPFKPGAARRGHIHDAHPAESGRVPHTPPERGDCVARHVHDQPAATVRRP
jgi:hypothetical protein